MKIHVIKPFFWLFLFALTIGLGCRMLDGAEEVPSAPTDVSQPVEAAPTEALTLPTQAPLPTQTPVPTREAIALPTNPPATNPPATNPPPPTEAPPISNEAPAFYIEEFDGDLSNYSYFVFLGEDEGSEMVYLDGGSLIFELEKRDTWVYFNYDPYIYEDVRVGMRVSNRGVNSQRVSLTCMVSQDGWFEFNIGGDGLYEILVYDAFDDNFYLIGNGGSTLISLGRNTNEYVAECIDDTLTLYINGEYVKSFSVPNDYRFMDEGGVGFGVSSFDVTPVRIEIEWFGIEEP